MDDIVEHLFVQADKKLEEGDMLGAITSYKAIAERDGIDTLSRSLAHTRIGDLCLGMRDLVKAEENLLKAIAIEPDSAQSRYLLGFTYSVQQRWEESAAQLQVALKLDPKNSEINRTLGWSIFFLGFEQEGLDLIKYSIELDPQNVNARNDLAACLIKQTLFDEAIGVLNETLEISPGDSHALENMKVAKYFKKEFQRSETANRRARKQRQSSQTQLDAVESLFSQQMLGAGLSHENIKNAKRLWRNFSERTKPSITKPETWAAAIEYSIIRFDFVEEASLEDVVRRYGVSRQGVVSKFKKICSELGL